MGLMDKIPEKLGGHKEEQQAYDQQHGSGSLQHPISSTTSRPTGTAVDNPSNTSSSIPGSFDKYDTSPSGTHGGPTSGTQTDVLRDSHGTSSTQHGGSDAYGSDKYGTQSSTLRFGSDKHDVTRGTDTYGDLPSREHQSSAADRIPMSGTSGTTTTTTSGHGPSTTTTSGYGGTHGVSSGQRYDTNDPSIARGSGGGVLNQTSDRNGSGSYGRDGTNFRDGLSSGHNTSSTDRYSGDRYGNNDRSPIGGSRTGDDRYGSNNYSNQQQHHYGRDAAIAGGAAGAGGYGAHEYDQRRHNDRNLSPGHNSSQYGTTSRHNNDHPYPVDIGRNNSPGRGYRENPYTGYGHQNQEYRKAGHAWDAGYDAGYRDAMDEIKHGRSGYGSSNEKPSMMDKLNPKKDATGDGEAGFMK